MCVFSLRPGVCLCIISFFRNVVVEELLLQVKGCGNGKKEQETYKYCIV